MQSVAQAIEEEIQDIIADLEEYAKRGEMPPPCRGYRIKINGEPYEVLQQYITGRKVLELGGFNPPKDFTIRVKTAGQPPRKVGLDEKIDLREPGIEKFKVTPREQTEGCNA